MKILHILNTNKYSGAENVVCQIIENCRSDKYEFCYVSLNGPIESILKTRNIDFVPVSCMSINELSRVFKEYKPDVIHAHDFTTSIISALTMSGLPIISHLHNNASWLKKFNLKSLAYLLSTVSYRKILTVSDSIINEYIFKNRIKKKTTVIGNPINLEYIRKKANIDISEYQNFKGYHLIYLGRLSAEKNPIGFLDIVKSAKKHIPGVKVVMVGDGELIDEVKAKIDIENLCETVTLTGYLENPYGYLKKSKVICIPSIWEGFGLVAVEAMALGIPVIASSVGGLKDIVNDKCGKLCSQPDQYSEEIVRLLIDEDYYKSKSENCLKRALELANIEKYCDNIKKIYNLVMRDRKEKENA